MTRPSIAYLLDPRFPGGTSSAVAAEIAAISQLADIRVHALSTGMFSGQNIAPQLQSVLIEHSIPVTWDDPVVSADTVIFHNPLCLKFQTELATQVMARQLFVVTHENFLRPGGQPSFDVAAIFGMISDKSLAMRKFIAPISPWNRQTVLDWIETDGPLSGWGVLDRDWFNICNFDLSEPTPAPQDRRGRHSRPGFEKFCSTLDLELCFPKHATNVILGSDLIEKDKTPAHWSLHKFRSLDVAQYFEMIDFLVYFTAPTFRESFGRVLAEGIAAGKVVISDRETALTFDGGVVATDPNGVDEVIKGYVASPERYKDQVLSAQQKLRAFSAEAFLNQIGPVLMEETAVAS